MACQSQPNGAASSCSSTPATPPVMPTFADGQPPISISDAVVTKVGELLA